MATPKQYWNTIKSSRNQVASSMGINADATPKDMRAMSNADLTCVAIVIKALTDKGLLTDAELLAARNAVLTEVWDDEPNLP